MTLLCSLRWRRVYAAFVAVMIFVLASLVPRHARAENGEVASFVGRQASGLPGLGRVAVASDNPRSLVASGGFGYAFTEAQANEVGAHHRLGGTLAVAVQPLRFLSGALMLDGRWEKHPDDVLGTSSTTVGEPRLFARAASGVTRSIALGAQLELLVPGAEAPSLRPDASRLDARALATFAPPGADLAVALNLGYRRDGTSNVLEPGERARLRSGDALTLGLSDFDAIVLGLGASKRFDAVEAFGELGWDVLLGTNAPSAMESPLRVGAGARYHLRDALQLEGRAEIALSERPTAPGGFAPIDPRVAVVFGVRYLLPFDKKPGDGPTKPGDDTTTKPPPAALLGSVEGHVKSEAGEPIAGARVTAGAERAADSAPDGTFRIHDVTPGKVRVSVKAAGFVDASIEIDVEAKKTAAAELVMKRTIKPGQLRGLVRSFNGKGLVATIRVEPIGTEVKTDADGTFTVDVPPGAYEVSIVAPGHAPQKRPVEVEENGVTILNADLRQGTTP